MENIKNEMIVPVISENIGRTTKIKDIYSRLLEDRIIFLQGEINEYSANLIISQLLYLEKEDNEKDIFLYINSPGGDIYSMWGIIDTMNHIHADVSTICIGMAASAASAVLVNGAPGKRKSLKHSRIMIHQPLGGISGQATDIAIHAKEIIDIKKELLDFYLEKTNYTKRKLEIDFERDKFIKTKEALELGLIDKIIE